MTTHVLIVDDKTFPIHLQYMFAGTGSKDKIINPIVNNTSHSINHATEAGLVSMIADSSRIRKGDFIIFYLQQSQEHEGMFFGIFQAINDGVFAEENNENQYLRGELEKSLTFRFLIKPFEVYPKGVTEWEALDVIRGLQSPNQMLWSLIYRKLKANRGNTMITIYEAERLFELIRNKNNRIKLSGEHFRFENQQISEAQSTNSYTGNQPYIDLLPRLINKYKSNKSHEAHLQAYILNTVGKGINKSLDDSINITNLEWIGNEVSCGVGMQRIDILLSQNISNIEREILPIELKCVPAEHNTVYQLIRYVDWLEQYYIPNRQSRIQPILICKKQNLVLDPIILQSFESFDNIMNGRCLPVKYIEYFINEQNNIVFERIK
ncbi:MAG: hypothetical protein IJS73_05360 [Paludibacteraceae bacterium]|nr:hypothetical protein [Paludibacteraceae bacterium]